ncbi:MAG: hypothetical protein EON58_16415 [Alphaproteobacteria bacterium]|nr:MAG: hypothetical protein EON58_16415 [Alphaproteobacteria bacterium]
MRETYSDVDVDHEAESVSFSITSFCGTFDAEFSFDALDTLIDEIAPGHELHCRETAAIAWQPELKDIAVELHRPGGRRLNVSAADIRNRRRRRH